MRVSAELGPPPPLRPRAIEAVQAAARVPSLSAANEFTMLGQKGRIAGPADWNDAARDKLWLYHCHYFEDLVASGFEQRCNWHCALIARWIADNPPGHGNGWEPYPLSLRISHWILWDWKCGGLDETARRSLAVQVRWLRRSVEWHILANHVIANLKALVLAGCWAGGEEGNHWLRYGLGALEVQVAEQVLADGGHIERSPMYHCQVLNDLLDVINGLRVAGVNVPGWLLNTVTAMGTWLAVMRHPDGDIPLFNDCALGMAPHPDALAAYGERLGHAWSMKKPESSVWLTSTGFARLCRGDAVVFCDGAPLGPDWQPGHGHADTLSWEASISGQRMVVDPGTSTYAASQERVRQRGTAAHNTIQINNLNSSEVWGSFRVGRRAKILSSKMSESGECFEASHDGYRAYGVTHQRVWTLFDGGLVISDRLIGGRKRLPWSNGVLLHPCCRVVGNEGKCIHVSCAGMAVDFHCDRGMYIYSSDYCHGFGLKNIAARIVVNGDSVPSDTTMKILWSKCV